MNEAWGEMKHALFTNTWNVLLRNEEFTMDFEGFEAADFHAILRRAGEMEVSVDNIHD